MRDADRVAPGCIRPSGKCSRANDKGLTGKPVRPSGSAREPMRVRSSYFGALAEPATAAAELDGVGGDGVAIVVAGALMAPGA